MRLPLRRPFAASHGSEHDRGVILLRLETAEAVGWGECSALSRPTYSEEWLNGAWQVLEQLLMPQLGTGEIPDIVGNRMARTAVEMALTDARLKAEGRSFADYLGVSKSCVPVGAVIGLLPDESALEEEVTRVLEVGYQRIKVKVTPGKAAQVVALVRAVVGNSVALFIDANGAFDRQGMAELCSLEQYGVTLIEQPFGVDEISLHAELAARTSTAVCLDESLRSVAQTREALVAKACDVVCLKAPRLGGYDRALEAHDVARGYGAACWVGGMIDTSLARAANTALAGLPGCSLASDLSAPENLLAADIAAEVLMSDGMMQIPTQPGFGVELDEEAIDRFTVRKQDFRL